MTQPRPKGASCDMRAVSDTQVRKLMEEMSKHGQVGRAAMHADMDRKTARKYVTAGKLPSELKRPRSWRTRQDAFADDWPAITAALTAAPGLEAKTIFAQLCETQPGRFDLGQLRTLQRKISRWRHTNGPEQAVVLAQAHRPGEAAQLDFTHTKELGIVVGGVALAAMLCVVVLPYSNWMWATVCHTESMAAIRHGLQRALFTLTRVPHYLQTDNSTAATHRGPTGMTPLEGRARPFNNEYLALLRHYSLEPRTIAVGAKEQNGDVEAGNGACKRMLTQALLLRGDVAFADLAAWQQFVDDNVRRKNAARGPRVAEEMAVMRKLGVAKLPEYVEEIVRVTARGTIRVRQCGYSVPSRLVGSRLTVHIYEHRLEAFYAGVLELACARARNGEVRIDYRHLIWSLVRKPGAFARYVYREELFPAAIFRRAYDAIHAAPSRKPANTLKSSSQNTTALDLVYLRILHLAASTMQGDVEAALALLFETAQPITVEAVKALVQTTTAEATADLALTLPAVELATYDELLAPAVAA